MIYWGNTIPLCLTRKVRNLATASFPGTVSHKGTLVLQNKLGSSVEVKHTYIPFGEMEKDAGAFLICWDLTYARKVQKMLHDAKEDMNQAVHQQQGIIFKFKKSEELYVHNLIDGDLLYQVGLTPEDCLGKTVHDFLPGAAAETSHDEAWSGKGAVYESDLFGRTVMISLRPVWENGQVREVIGSVVDISERKA
jgi:PAS fold